MRRRLLLLGLLVVLAAGPAGADYRQSYLDGLKAVDRGDWDEAIRLLEAAVAERPVEQERARLVGAIPEPYLPHFYLARAHFASRDCDRAVDQGVISREQGAIQAQAALAAELGEILAHCGELAVALGAVRDAEAAARTESEPGDLDPELAARRRAAVRSIAEARQKLDRGRAEWDFALIAAARELAATARVELRAVRTEARLEAAARRRQDLRREIADQVAASRPLLAAAQQYPGVLEVQAAADDLRPLVEGSDAEDVADLETLAERLPPALERLRDALRQARAVPEPPLPEPSAAASEEPPSPSPEPAEPSPKAIPEPLLAAAESYFSGDYAALSLGKSPSIAAQSHQRNQKREANPWDENTR